MLPGNGGIDDTVTGGAGGSPTLPAGAVRCVGSP